MDLKIRLSDFESLIADNDLTLAQIDDFAMKEDPQNVYFKNGDSIEFDPKKGLEF